MAQVALSTTRLDLVPLSEDHLEHEVELDSDPEVLRYLWGGRPSGVSGRRIRPDLCEYMP